jgi:signal transduction histidine kinase
VKFPIRTRLAVVYCAVFCLGAGALEAGTYAGLTLAVYAIADHDLQSRLVGVEEFLGEHVPRFSLSRIQAELKTHAALQPDYLQISDDRMGIMFQSPSLAPYERETARNPGPRYWTGNAAGRPLRILIVRRPIAGHEYELRLASDLSSPLEILRRFSVILLLTFPVVMAAAIAAGHWMAGRALSPVLAITTAARSIDTTDLGRRIKVPDGHDELQFLAETLNCMLQRIEDGFARTTQFVANASHELRTPVAVIRATAEVALLRPPSTGSDRLALQRILREAEKNTVLLEDMLSLARIDSGVSLRLAKVDLAEIVGVTCEHFAPLATKRGVTLHWASPPALQWVWAEASHLKRLVLILLDNATKYTPRGGRIDVSVDDSMGDQASFQVKDSGIGISDADLPHIFERFYRADPARNREEGGSGLGLSIARWIAEAHHGAIHAESSVGRGSTFRVALPRLVHGSSVPDTAGHKPALTQSKI